MSFKKTKDKDFYKAMFAIALPITLQNLIASSVNMIDTLMITSLGKESLAAVGLANQVFFFYSVIVFGVATGSAIFIAQFWGKKDILNIRKILGLSLLISCIIGLVFTISAFFAPSSIMKIFTKEVEVVNLGRDYLKIVSLSYIITAISFSFSVASRSIGDAKMPMVVSIISFLTNTLFNYLLIFGKFGFPQLGVKGAAYGTLIARMVEVVLILYAVYSSHGPLAGNFSELSSWDKNYVKKYFKTAYPVILNETFWSLGNVMYSIAYAKIGTEATAAVQITSTVQNIFLVFSRGLANSCTVMVGNKIGEGNEEEAVDYANKFLKIAVILGTFLGVILFFTTDLALMLFRNLPEDLYEASKSMIIVLAIFLPIKMFNGNLIVGVFRGGGDTKFSMMVEMGAVWAVGVPLAFLGATVFKLPVYLVSVLVNMEEVVKAIIGVPRVLSNKWVQNVVENM